MRMTDKDIENSIKHIQHLMFHDKRSLGYIARRTGLNPKTVSNMRYKLTQSPHFRTYAKLFNFYYGH